MEKLSGPESARIFPGDVCPVHGASCLSRAAISSSKGALYEDIGLSNGRRTVRVLCLAPLLVGHKDICKLVHLCPVKDPNGALDLAVRRALPNPEVGKRTMSNAIMRAVYAP